MHAQYSNTKIEGTGSQSLVVGQPQVDGSTVGLWHLDETSGTGAFLKDSSGNANHGTATGAASVKGFIGRTINFNGSSDFINITDNANLGQTAAMSVEAWIYPKTFIFCPADMWNTKSR